jgi:X-X-X-Leu-X-X-Gly heptad repeat protein
VAEQEKQLITANLSEAKQQIEVERAERAKVQEQTTQLAQGVGQLAEKSGELSQEIRTNRPVNPNLIFSEFQANRVQTKITARKPGLFRPSTKDLEAQTVLVSDGNRTYAVMHLSDTPISLTETPSDYQSLTGTLNRSGASAPVSELHFLRLDPRILVVPVDESVVARMGAKVYQLAKEPFKFPEAVLVRADDGRYGETPLRIDPSSNSYLKLDNRIVTRLFGEISPKRGDLVFSKSGEVIGILVNSDYCAVLGDFTAAHVVRTGDNPGTNGVLTDLQNRWTRLPPKFQ